MKNEDLLRAKQKLWVTLANGAKLNSKPDACGVDVEYIQMAKLVERQKAREALWATLSGTPVPKHNSAPCGCEKCRAAARDSLQKQMSGGKTAYKQPPPERSTTVDMYGDGVDGVKVCSTTSPGARTDLQKARLQLNETLSAKNKTVKINMKPVDPRLTPSEGVKMMADDRVKEGELANIEKWTKLAAARSELQTTMRQNARSVKTMQADDDDNNSSGKRNVILDSPIVEKNRVFDGVFQITAHRKNIDELYAEQDLLRDTKSPSPAASSSDDADDDLDVDSGGDWAPAQADDEFQPEEARQCLLGQFSRRDGSVSRKLAKHFLHVSGDPEDPESYESALPLSVVDPVSQLIRSHHAALDEGFRVASGAYNESANYPLMRNVLKLKRKNGFNFDQEQNEFVQRHGL